jgi:hypothetical protein
MKPTITIPQIASSLRVVALNKKNIEADINDETGIQHKNPKDIRKNREEKPATEKKKPEMFEYRIKEKKHDPL